MSRKPSFANLRDRQPAQAVAQPAPEPAGKGKGSSAPASARAASREGRKQIAGFFTPEMSFAMHMLARRQGRSLQALMTEAFDDVLRKHGESPLGE
jgi:hypothetical protein